MERHERVVIFGRERAREQTWQPVALWVKAKSRLGVGEAGTSRPKAPATAISSRMVNNAARLKIRNSANPAAMRIEDVQFKLSGMMIGVTFLAWENTKPEEREEH
jgi:hypothetical protein